MKNSEKKVIFQCSLAGRTVDAPLTENPASVMNLVSAMGQIESTAVGGPTTASACVGRSVTWDN